MKKLNYLLFIFLLFAGNCYPQQDFIETEGWNKVDEILARIVSPEFPDKDFNILDFGAAADGKTLSTEAFRRAVEACNKAGGGRVVVPEGEFLTGAVHLKSNVNLYISENAIVKFSIDPKDYLPVVFTRWEGVELMNYSPLIYAYEQENIAVTGKGILHGQASNENWWPWKGRKEFGGVEVSESQNDPGSRPRLLKLNDEQVPVEERIFGEGSYLRPPFVQFYKCENILIEGVTFKDSPFWFIHPVLSKNITVLNITAEGLGPNNDGCNPESCTDVLIKGCTFNTGDDCIAIKSGRNGDGKRINTPSKNIVIQNCKMKDGHGGVVMGSEITGGVSNVYAENCEMDSPNLDRMLRVKSNSKRGGIVQNIFVRNIKVGEVKEAIIKLNMLYDPGEVDNEKNYPVMKNISIENVTSNKSKYGLFFDGLEESPVENIVIKDCRFNGVEKGNKLNNVKNLSLEDFYINAKLVEEEEELMLSE